MSDVRRCPSCGSRRMGAFRYCLACRLDYDALGPGRGPTGREIEPSWPDPEEARAAILDPGFGAPPRAPLQPSRPARRAASGWLTNAVASIGLVALIGVAFGSTGLVPLGAGATPGGTVLWDTIAPTTPEVATAAPDDPAAGHPATSQAGGPGAPSTGRPAPPPGTERVIETPVAVTRTATSLQGRAGTWTWSSLGFGDPFARLTWSATSDRAAGCTLRWTLEGADGKAAKGQLKVRGTAKGHADRSVRVKRGTGRLVVTTDCQAWSVRLTARSSG